MVASTMSLKCCRLATGCPCGTCFARTHPDQVRRNPSGRPAGELKGRAYLTSFVATLPKQSPPTTASANLSRCCPSAGRMPCATTDNDAASRAVAEQRWAMHRVCSQPGRWSPKSARTMSCEARVYAAPHSCPKRRMHPSVEIALDPLKTVHHSYHVATLPPRHGQAHKRPKLKSSRSRSPPPSAPPPPG